VLRCCTRSHTREATLRISGTSMAAGTTQSMEAPRRKRRGILPVRSGIYF
jgi:hypothetical protein